MDVVLVMLTALAVASISAVVLQITLIAAEFLTVLVVGFGRFFYDRKKTDEPAEGARPKFAQSPAVKILNFGGVLMLATAALGWLYPAPLIRYAMDEVEERTDVQIDFSDAALNPLSISVEIEDLKVDGTPAAGLETDVTVDRIFVDVAAFSIFGRAAYDIDALEISGVRGNVRQQLAGRNDEEAPRETEAPEESFPRIHVDRFRVADVDMELELAYGERSMSGDIVLENLAADHIEHPGLPLHVIFGTSGSGEVFGAKFSSGVEKTKTEIATTWEIRNLSLSELGTLLGGPMRFVTAGEADLSMTFLLDIEELAASRIRLEMNFEGVKIGSTDEGEKPGLLARTFGGMDGAPEDFDIDFEMDAAEVTAVALRAILDGDSIVDSLLEHVRQNILDGFRR